MTPTERDTARAAHAEAVRLTGEARTALATATTARGDAVAARADLVKKAAAGSKISPATLVSAGRDVTEADAAIELAAAIVTAAAAREAETIEPLRQAEHEDRQERLAAAVQRRIASAEKVDDAIAKVILAFAELDATAPDISQNGGEHPGKYFLNINGKNFSSIADLERRVHLPRQPLTPAQEFWRARMMGT